MAATWKEADPGVEPRFSRGAFSWSNHTSDLTVKVNSAKLTSTSLPISVTCPVYRNITEEESSLGVGLKRIYTSSESSECHAHEPET